MTHRDPGAFPKALGIMLLAMVVLWILVTAGLIVGFGGQVAESQYSGDVADVEEDSGIVWKTTQVEIKTDSEATEPETFCVHPDRTGQIISDLRRAQSGDHRVTVTYERGYLEPVWRCEGETDGRRIIDVTVYGGGSA